MNRKDYQKPAMQVIILQQTQMLAASGEVHATMNGTFTESDLDEEPASVKAHRNYVDWDEE